MKPFPGNFTIARQETWSAVHAAGKYADQPLKASCASYAEELAQLALCPEPNLGTLSGLGPVHKPQSRHADANRWRKNLSQGDEAGHQSGTRNEYVI